MPASVAVASGTDVPARVESRALTTLASLEAALADGLEQEWRRVVGDDPLASMFQTAGWCMPWYRCYADSYDPYVIVVSSKGRTVGIVPMAVERATRSFAFASSRMADYRDIVALPGYREQVLRELIRHYTAGNFSGTLPIGWIDPASDTPALIAKICAERGLRYTVKQHVCYRWVPPPPAKPSAQKFLNWYKRNGTVAFEVIDNEAAWQRFREEYYRQHTLRQIQTGRPTAFDDPRNQALYEEVFHSKEVQSHVTAFLHNGRMLAGHFGYVWRGVLSLGPPSIRLEDEQRSPAVILLSWIIQNAETLGLKGFDLTIGDAEFKKRLGNQSVDLTFIDVYARTHRYYAHAARQGAVDLLKRAVERIAGEGSWKSRVKPAIAHLAYKQQRLKEMGLVNAFRAAAAVAIGRVFERRVGLVYAMTPDQLRPVTPRLAAGETFEAHENRIEDLLLWQGNSASTASRLTECARTYSRVRASGRTLHTILVNGKLAGWGYSYQPTGPAELTETPGATLEFVTGDVSLYDFHVLPEFRGRRVYQALLSDILRRRFAEGAVRAYISVLESNTPSRVAIERVGFAAIRRNVYRRVFNRKSLTPTQVPAL